MLTGVFSIMNRDQRQALANKVINLRAPQNSQNLLYALRTVRFYRICLLHGVTQGKRKFVTALNLLSSTP
jgi:hypothetical protein